MNKKNNFNSIWPTFSKSELKKVNQVLKSGKVNYWTGEYCKLFEKKYSKYHQVKYCVTVNSGTSALDCAIKSLNLKKGSEIITTPRSYYTSASSIINSGMKPKFIDISIDTQNLDPESLKNSITKKTKAIICVHLAGNPCDMDKIMRIAKKFKILVIEDCSQAHGAKIKKKLVGSFGDVAIWSFCQDKIISTGGEGGMIATNKLKIYNQILSIKDNGRNYQKLKNINYSGTFNYIHDFIGNNYRMTEIQAVIGISQLSRLDEMIKKRNRNVLIFKKYLGDLHQITFLKYPSENLNSFYRFYFFVKLKKHQKILINNIRKYGIDCMAGSCPEIYLEKYFKNNFNFKRLPVSRFIGERSICLKVDQTINKNIIEQHAKIIKKEIIKLG
tara:strand:+ start:5188 stop:6345 length:1158 start_codon:yes stop_codon:yes gene_type:complete